MICGMALDLQQSLGKFPCAVCRTGVTRNNITTFVFLRQMGKFIWGPISRWILETMEWPASASSTMAASTGCTRNAVGSSAWQRTLITDYMVPGNCMLFGRRPQREVHVRPDKLEVVASFSYLGDMLSAGDGCELSVTTCVIITWKKLLPVHSSCDLSFKTRGQAFSSCVWGALINASETWPLTKPNLQRL